MERLLVETLAHQAGDVAATDLGLRRFSYRRSSQGQLLFVHRHGEREVHGVIPDDANGPRHHVAAFYDAMEVDQ